MITIDKLVEPTNDYLIVEANSPMITDAGIELLDAFRDKVTGEMVKTDNTDQVYKILAVGPKATDEGYKIGDLVLLARGASAMVTVLKKEGQMLIRTYEIAARVVSNYREQIAKVKQKETEKFLKSDNKKSK